MKEAVKAYLGRKISFSEMNQKNNPKSLTNENKGAIIVNAVR